MALIVTVSRGEKNDKTARSRPVTKSASLFKDGGGSQRFRFNESIKDKKSFSSAEEASKELPFKLKLPNSKAVGKLYRLLVDTHDGHEPPSARVFYYSDDPALGISLSATLSEQKYDAKAYVDQMVASKEAGELKSDNVPFLVDINGFAGAAQEPGYNVILSQTEPRNRRCQFGTTNENTTSAETFLEIARSISK